MKMNYIKYVLSCVMLAMAAHVSAISVTVDAVNIEAGQSNEIIISLNNTETNLTAYQLSLYLPDGVTLHKKANGKYDYTLSNRHESTHTMSIKDAADGSLLLVCSSMDKDVISGTSGELLRLPIDVASTVTTSLQAQLKNMVFSDVNSQKSYPSDVTFNLQLAGEDPVVNPDDIAITIPDVSVTAGGSAEIVVSLTNSATNLTAYQMSLYLPAGVTLHKKANGKYDYTLSDRHENTHTLSIKDAADGSLLLVCSSMDKDVISGTSGELLRLPIDVASTVTTSLQAQMKNMVFSDVNSQKSYPSDVTFNLVFGGSSNNISFTDSAVKEICVANWDTSGDGKLSFNEAAAVNDLDEVFKYNEEITSFNELQYFTGLTDIGDHAFAGCTALTSVTLPSTVTHIYDGAFEGCLQLESVDFNGCKVAIHSVAFSECRNLTSLVLPVGCYPDGYSVFNGCSSLLSVVMEPCDNPVEVWSSDVFRDCNSLETATVYGRYLHGPGNFTNCSRLTTVTFIDDIPGNSFSQNFQGVPDDVLFVIPDGSAETFLHNGYFNLSDKSGLGMVRDEFEAEAERIVLMSMANSANVLANGNLESTDVSCFLSKEYPSEDIVPATIVENEGVNGSRCVAVTSKAGAAHDYDTQFWIRLPKTLPAGTKYKLSFDYRATAAVSINTECHNEPGQYVEWGCLPFSDFTTTWQHFDEVVTVPATCDGTDNGEFLKDFRSITFTLAADREKNITFYFDNFRLLLVEESPLLNAVNQARTVVNNATDYADVFGQIDVIKQAGRDFLAANELADEVDVTGAFILNPDFDRFDRGWQAPMGWITSGYQNGRCENGDVVIDQFIQIWRSEWIDDHDEPSVLDDYKLSQTIRQLPAGNYRLEADCIASWSTDDRDITGAYLFVGDEQVPVATLHGKPQHYTLDFTISEASDVEIGMKTFNTNANWIAADNFRLYSIYPSNDPTDITQLNNAIYVEPQIGNVGRAFSMDVKLKNELSIRAYEFKLKLPQGVTLETDNNGAWLYELSGRNSNYSPKLNYDAATNTYHFAVMSTVSGNDGAVMTLKLQVSDEMVVGEYPIRIYDVKYSLTEAYQTLPVQETVSTLNIQEKTFLKGDANDDDQVDIADVVCVVNHVVDLPNVKFVEAAANVNDDDDVDLTDAVKIVDYIVGVIDVLAPAFQPVDLDQSALAPSLDMPLAESLAITKTAPAGLSDALYADDLTVMPGKDVLMPVSLKNAQTARGYSFDLVLPEGVTLAKTNGGEYICELSDRQTGYVVRVNYKENVRTYSLLVYTLSENVLTGNDGVVCTLKLQAAADAVLGQYAASIQNCKYSTANSSSVALPRMEIALSIGSTLKGDANGDGSVTMADAVAVVNYILGNSSAGFNINNANVNDDVDEFDNPKISISDAVGIVNIILNNSGSSSASEAISLP